MISSIRNTRVAPPRARVRPGFTLVELMAVIGIIVVLMAILVPSITRAVRQAQRTRMSYDLQMIAQALDHYKNDFHSYPPVTRGMGANILARALIAPAPAVGPADPDFDGADGPGFRTKLALSSGGGPAVQQGKVWGPYLPADGFHIAQIPFSSATDAHWVILDRKDVPILYFPLHRGANINAANGYVADSSAPTGGNPMWDLADNAPSVWPSPGTANGYYLDASKSFLSLQAFQTMMGADSTGKAVTPAYVVKTDGFILWSAGPDGLWGPKDPTQPISSRNRADDVANFDRSEY